jgi:hypothetical protein
MEMYGGIMQLFGMEDTFQFHLASSQFTSRFASFPLYFLPPFVNSIGTAQSI